MTQKQADDCNAVLAAVRPILPALNDLADAGARVDNAQKLTAAASKIGPIYQREAGSIANAAKAVGIVLVRTSQDLLNQQDIGLDREQLLASTTALDDACHIKPSS